MKNVRVILFIGIALVFGACSTPAPQQIKDSVTISDGTVSGSFDESTGITTFKGIPFAAPSRGRFTLESSSTRSTVGRCERMY